MEDVAKRAGVSRALVSLALSGSTKVSEHSRQAVLDATQELGYRPNLMARTLASRRTMTIGVLLDDLHNPFYADVADGLLSAATERGYRVLLTAGLRQGETQKMAVDTLLQLHADGVILVSPRFGRDEIEQRAVHVPFVVVGEPLEAGVIDTVTIDEQAAVADVVDYLHGLGHRAIAHVDGGVGAAAAIRRTAYEARMIELGLGDHVKVIPGEFTEQAGYDAAQTVLEQPGPLPTAIFAANDLIAAGVLNGLERRGVRVPDQISIVGFDNVIYSSMGRLSITTVNQRREEMGRLAIETLVERLEGRRTEGRRHTLPTELVIRGSTAPPRADAR
jgi:DNA-binding LacI/PurR family transcriptional regulator